MEINNLGSMVHANVMKKTGKEMVENKAENDTGEMSFSKYIGKMNCPYGYLAKDGIINYKGVTFVCDEKTNSICLGDMSDLKNVLNISLPSGGHLKLNVNNFDDIAKATGMFSAEDLNAIMRAIHQYNHCTKKLEEIEEEENERIYGLISQKTC